MRLRIRAQRLWDGKAGWNEPAEVLVEGDRILETRKVAGDDRTSAEAQDFGDATILPGLVDMHTHLGINHATGDIREQMRDAPVRHILAGAASLRDDLRSGVTTAKLNGDRDHYDIQMRDAIRERRADGPQLIVSGKGIKSSRCTGGVVATCIADDPAAVGRGADASIAAGADWVKLFASGSVFGPLAEVLQPFYGLEALAVAVHKAHAAGKRVSVHCFGGEAADACIQAGVDVIDHGWLLSERQLERMAGAKIWLCPTVGVLAHPHGVLAHVQGQSALDAGRKRVDEVLAVERRAVQMGVSLLAGTDAMHGCLPYELEVLQDLGAKPQDLLAAATSRAGLALGREGSVGVIEKGGRADLLVVRGNALEDVRRLSQPLLVMQAGRVVRSES